MDDPLGRFTGLYDRYYRNVLRYALLHAEAGSAEDVTSEVFLIAWRQLPVIPEPSLPWLLGVARNLLRKQADASRRRRLLADRIAALTTEADVIAGASPRRRSSPKRRRHRAGKAAGPPSGPATGLAPLGRHA